MNKVNLTVPERDFASREAFKSLRANLQFCGADIKTVGVTSCVANEGKSTIVLDLGIALAESGKKTLVIDADMRNSIMMGMTSASIVSESPLKGGEKLKGLSHFLSGQSTIKDIVNATNIPNFYIIFSGPFPPNPSELLEGTYFKKMIGNLRNIFDYILIDTPPIGLVIDAAIVSEVCDGSILVIASKEISYRFAQDAKEQMERSNTPVLGVILNKVETQNESYGKYGKYGRYGKYGKYGSYGSYGYYGQRSQDGDHAQQEQVSIDLMAGLKEDTKEQKENANV